MSTSLKLSCMLLLGRAISELYPSAILIGGDADEVQFSYDFVLDQPLDDRVLPLIEEKILGWIREQVPFVSSEMLQSNAIDFFTFHRRHAQADILSRDIVKNRLVGLARSGSFFDWVEGELLPHAGEIKAFKLLEIVPLQEGWRIVGTAESSRDLLKSLIKNIKQAQKNHHLDKGEMKGWWIYHPNQEEIVFLKEGIARRREIVGQVERVLDEEGWDACAFVEPLSEREELLQSLIQESSRQAKVYTTALVSRDVRFSRSLALFSLQATSACLGVWSSDLDDLRVNVKSSLKLIAKTCRILGFEVSWTLVLPKDRPKRAGGGSNRKKTQPDKLGDSLFFEGCRQAFEELGWKFDLKFCRREEDGRAVAKVFDQLGRGWELGCLSCLSGKKVSSLLREVGEDGKNFKEILIVEPLVSAETVMALQLESLTGWSEKRED